MTDPEQLAMSDDSLLGRIRELRSLFLPDGTLADPDSISWVGIGLARVHAAAEREAAEFHSVSKLRSDLCLAENRAEAAEARAERLAELLRRAAKAGYSDGTFPDELMDEIDAALASGAREGK